MPYHINIPKLPVTLARRVFCYEVIEQSPNYVGMERRVICIYRKKNGALLTGRSRVKVGALRECPMQISQ